MRAAKASESIRIISGRAYITLLSLETSHNPKILIIKYISPKVFLFFVSSTFLNPVTLFFTIRIETSSIRNTIPSITTELFLSKIKGSVSPPIPEPICRIFLINSELSFSLFSSLLSRRKKSIKAARTNIILTISIFYHLFHYKIRIEKCHILFMKLPIQLLHPFIFFPIYICFFSSKHYFAIRLFII